MKKIIAILVCIGLLSTIGNAQNNSIYSRFGVGDMQYAYFPHQVGSGDLGTMLFGMKTFSTHNPATLSRIKNTTLEFGTIFNARQIDTENESAFFSTGEFTGFTLALPVSLEYGASIAGGVVPYSTVSYKNKTTVSDDEFDVGSYTLLNEGDGGLSRAFIGGSFRLPFDVTIGAYFDYYVGKTTYSSKIEFDNPVYVDTDYRTMHQTKGYGGTVGVISPDLGNIIGSETVKDIRLGIGFTLPFDIETDTINATYSTVYSDTISMGNTLQKIPMRIVAGLGFKINNAYHCYLDYLYQPWSEYTFDDITDPNLSDAMKFSAGFQYYTNPDRPLEHIVWRAGISYEKTPYSIRGVDINEFSISGGLSYPVGVGNTIDIGIQYVNRGSKDSGLLKENIFRLGFGVSLGELWFLRRQR